MAERDTAPGRILLTGAAGSVGSVLRPALREETADLHLVDRQPLGPPGSGETCTQVDLRDFAPVLPLMNGTDTAVHLAAHPGEAPFPRILDDTIQTTFHGLEAARPCGLARMRRR